SAAATPWSASSPISRPPPRRSRRAPRYPTIASARRSPPPAPTGPATAEDPHRPPSPQDLIGPIAGEGVSSSRGDEYPLRAALSFFLDRCSPEQRRTKMSKTRSPKEDPQEQAAEHETPVGDVSRRAFLRLGALAGAGASVAGLW